MMCFFSLKIPFLLDNSARAKVNARTEGWAGRWSKGDGFQGENGMNKQFFGNLLLIIVINSEFSNSLNQSHR